MDKKIYEIYVENFYPSLNELYKLLQEEGISITKAKVKEFLDNQHEQQITKQTKVMKKDDGAIVASYPNQMWQLDNNLYYRNTSSTTTVTEICYVLLTYLHAKHTL
jgi:arginine repressor